LALQSAFLDNPAVQFDLDSFSIGIDNHASQCMVNTSHIFEDLQLTDNAGEVNIFGAMTKIPWRGKETKASYEVFTATKLGECISVNQMVSTEVGFFAQMKGKLTKKRYRCATIFSNHYSCLAFVHLQVDNSSTETIAAKRALEAFATKHGVKIQHYHCNNGCFFNNAFKQACHDA
jgi:hypothetical protein